MGIPVKSRWWLLSLLVVGVLLLISALALDPPNVVWDGYKPHCPFCLHEVEPYSHRCADCRGDFDWTVASKDASPISQDSLSVLEAEWVRARVEALGLEEATRLVADATGLSTQAAEAYVQRVGRGDCGWCGGTKKDLSASDLEEAPPCPCCLGTGDSVACAGDRHVRIGDPTAHHALARYRAAMADILRDDGTVLASERASEARRLGEEFLHLHAGTLEAAHILYWGDIASPRTQGGRAHLAPRTVTEVARGRLDQVLKALQAQP